MGADHRVGELVSGRTRRRVRADTGGYIWGHSAKTRDTEYQSYSVQNTQHKRHDLI